MCDREQESCLGNQPKDFWEAGQANARHRLSSIGTFATRQDSDNQVCLLAGVNLQNGALWLFFHSFSSPS